MSKKIVYTLIIIVLLISILIFKFNKKQNIPIIKLKGKRIVKLFDNQIYKEPGFIAKISNRNVNDKVKIEGVINYEKEGTYELIYTIKEKKRKSRGT